MLNHSAKRYWLVLFSNIVIILLAIYISLTNGIFDITVQDVLKTLLRIDPVPEHDLVILDFRLPRIVIAALVGFGLGIAGATIQGISRNGLADPGILGINAGAGAMIVIFMLFFGGRMTVESDWLSILAMPLFGWVGGLGAALLIYLFARQNGHLDTQRLILVGIAAGSGFGALSLYLSLKMNPQDFEMATVWLAGSIWNANWQYIVAMLPWIILLVPIIISKAYILDLFQLGEDSAKSLGVSTEKEKNILLLTSIGIVSACVSVSGNIGFVGLIAPHIAKRLVGIYHQRVIPISGTIGMLLVVVSDFIAKTVFAPVELSVGIVIAIIGIPYFVYLLFKTKV
ncbi:fecCD transport family protein [Anoxybacillus sp. B7M1]|jgi:iron complex transport system permease protein|uniref:Iron ABC transporter permease n=1 Tax=Anoxybacteroides rupiense TaxID=311460 RepID=A0ABD5IZN6_9BACL|nr:MULTISPECIES: iron ABC transporter permease [Anoxybacillus]ANB57674.1 fecCD transport family protein [Anoxybacillus sp. B2M1]ANB62469.1 fecCD transport family protein [Anoxybacillus sp. B7M1]KXG09507.1 Iron-uptake system permease protein FeuC [Anoxybacillus sp. P3H1B]MBB3908857.1 iron complex transport system permease protein [Anoxybacillus rupiensis]MBS2771913.1 iron ABC transporter permease [Anoxybacillus rupiensis]